MRCAHGKAVCEDQVDPGRRFREALGHAAGDEQTGRKGQGQNDRRSGRVSSPPLTPRVERHAQSEQGRKRGQRKGGALHGGSIESARRKEYRPIASPEPTDELRRIEQGGREILLLGTAHVSRESVEAVRAAIEGEDLDRVCVELDPRRRAALEEGQRFESLDLREVLRRRQVPSLLVNLLLAGYQRRIGEELGVTPGSELLEAIRAAERRGIPVSLVDRDIGLTLRRAWAAMTWITRVRFAATLLASLFVSEEISESDLRRLRQGDTLNRVLTELGDAFPGLKRVLIDERDRYLCENIRRAKGRRVLAVVGAGHVVGIEAELARDAPVDLGELEAVPARRRGLSLVGWAVPALILGALVVIGVRQGVGAAGQGALYWILANGIPAGLGAVVAGAHPLTVLVAFCAAPITSLTPVIGAGYVAAFAQTFFSPPRVAELVSAVDDAAHWRKWWENRLLRILVVFVLTTLGSVLGTFVGGAEILSRLL